jgi:hypothetical protein
MRTSSFLSIAAALAYGSVSPATAQRLNDTGQITCYNATASTGTVSSGTPDPETTGFNEQDCTRGAAAANALGRMVKVGASTAPGRDYTKIANDGSVLPASATLGTGPTDWGCTRDNITGLIWEVKTASGLRSQGHTYTWYDTNPAVNGGTAGTEAGTGCNSTLTNCNTTAYRDAVNALTGSSRLCGATDWRLPTTVELRSLVHLGASNPSIDSTWVPNTPSGVFWTGATYAPVVSSAWEINFNDGSVNASDKSNGRSIRLVRGGQ